MASLKKTVEIVAPVEQVFKTVTEEWEGKLTFWTGGIHKWTPQADRKLGNGFRVRYLARVLGVPLPIEMEVGDFEPNVGWKAVSKKGPDVTGVWRFESSNGITHFTYHLDYTLPIPLFRTQIDQHLVAPRWQRIIERSLDNLKHAVERQQGQVIS